MRRATAVAIVLTLFIAVPDFSAAEERTQVGLGIGIPYGGIGGNVEHHVIDHLAFTGGAGYVPDNFAWNVGARIYFVGLKKKFRPRFSILYGVNDVVDLKERSHDTFEGFTLGLGFEHRYWKKWGWNVDFTWNDEDRAVENLQSEGKGDRYGSDVKGSLGFTYRF